MKLVSEDKNAGLIIAICLLFLPIFWTEVRHYNSIVEKFIGSGTYMVPIMKHFYIRFVLLKILYMVLALSASAVLCKKRGYIELVAVIVSLVTAACVGYFSPY